MDHAEAFQGNEREIVTFRVSDQEFCVDIGYVREIRGWSPTTVLPHAPDYVKGMMNLRGTVLPVMDLSLRLGLGPTEATPRHVIIILVVNEMTVGLLVEAVSDILTVSNEDMKATPDIGSTETKNFVEGFFTVDDRMIRAVDVACAVPASTGEQR